jgi:hypothetical protein
MFRGTTGRSHNVATAARRHRDGLTHPSTAARGGGSPLPPFQAARVERATSPGPHARGDAHLAPHRRRKRGNPREQDEAEG